MRLGLAARLRVGSSSGDGVRGRVGLLTFIVSVSLGTLGVAITSVSEALAVRVNRTCETVVVSSTSAVSVRLQEAEGSAPLLRVSVGARLWVSP